jgi:serine protease AprX
MGEARRSRGLALPWARASVALATAALFGALALGADGAAPRPDRDLRHASGLGAAVGLVVREGHPRSPLAERLVRRLGGRVTRQLPIVDGFAAEVPAAALTELERSPAVVALWRDGRVAMADDDDDFDDVTLYDALPADTVWREAIGLRAVERRYDGEDVAVAVVDTGVAPAADLSDNVEARVEFTPGNDGIDRFGHGTHIAGIIAGDGSSSRGKWRGVATDADLVSIKVAGPDGTTDVSVVLAALQWVAANKDRFGIRVLNLSFGTDATRSYLTDPLNYAVERVWRSGILVVTAAGNGGPATGSISKPGDDPFVLTVGAADVRGTIDRADDEVAPFSSRGPTADAIAKPDLVAPGISIVSVRARDSAADLDRPDARVDRAYFKGSGTSQAGAIVSGIAALLFDAAPRLTPDEAKAALVATSSGLEGQPGAGHGLVDAARAVEAVRTRAYANAGINGPYAPATGAGALEPSRGTYHVYGDPDGDGVPQLVDGELDVLGNEWDRVAWPTAAWSRLDWRVSPWSRLVGEAEEFERMRQPVARWSGTVFDAAAWSAKYWSGAAWVAKYWSAKYWSASVWN